MPQASPSAPQPEHAEAGDEREATTGVPGGVGVASIVGGGPAGLMAAEVLAGAGVEVTVYEHMPSVGRKLLLAGRSGLNLTVDEPIDVLLKRYGDAATALAASLHSFTPDRLRAWSASLGQPTFVGSSGRVFPEAMRAAPLLRAWIARLRELDVAFVARHRWVGSVGVEAGDGRPNRIRSHFRRDDGTAVTVDADVTVLALGGASWPRVGSDGGWVTALRAAGVRVADLRAANCGVAVQWAPPFAERFAGVALRNVRLAVGDVSHRGGVTVTRSGLEGGAVYALVPTIRRRLDAVAQDGVAQDGVGTCRLGVDLHPDLGVDTVRARLGRARPKDSLSTTLRRTLGLDPVARALVRSAIGGGLRPDDAALAALVKNVPIDVQGLMPLDRAISSAGGICWDEVDDTFMLRRLPGVFVAGEMLDWEAPTGGYLLQASFSSAVAAAHGAGSWLSRRRAG